MHVEEWEGLLVALQAIYQSVQEERAVFVRGTPMLTFCKEDKVIVSYRGFRRLGR